MRVALERVGDVNKLARAFFIIADPRCSGRHVGTESLMLVVRPNRKSCSFTSSSAPSEGIKAALSELEKHAGQVSADSLPPLHDAIPLPKSFIA